MADRYSGFSVVLNGTAYNQIRDVGLPSGNTLAEFRPQGKASRGAVMTSFAEPVAAISTEAVATFLALNSAAFANKGLDCTSGAVLQYQKRQAQGLYAGSGHKLWTSGAGFLYPTRLAADQDSTSGAVLDMMYCALSVEDTLPAGEEPPWTPSTGSLTGTPAFVAAYFLACSYVGGTEVSNLVGMSIDFGLSVQHKRWCGKPFATECFVIAQGPTLNLRFEALPTALHGAALSGAGIEVYLQKGLASNTRTDPATSAHIKISCATGAQHTDEVSVRGNGDGTTTLSIRPTDQLTVSTATALP